MTNGRMVRRDARIPSDYGCTFCGTCWGQPSRSGHCDATQCKACGSVQCMGNGLGRGQCAICFAGLLPGWSGTDRACGYKGCKERAIAAAPRVGYVCGTHALRAIHNRTGGGQTVAEHIRRCLDVAPLMWVFVTAPATRDRSTTIEPWRHLPMPERASESIDRDAFFQSRR
jgi:hypothetical protein